jgi:hypothetical protein
MLQSLSMLATLNAYKCLPIIALQFLCDIMRYIDYDFVIILSCKCWLCYTKSSPLNCCATLSSINGVAAVGRKYVILETFVISFDVQRFVHNILWKMVELRYCGSLRCLL